MTALSKSLEKRLTARDGHVCADCGQDNETLVPQHRANRGMGGRRSMDRLSNLVWVCSAWNGDVESNAVAAERARRTGLKISSNDEPSHVPLVHAVHGRCLLQDDGSVVTGLAVF